MLKISKVLEEISFFGWLNAFSTSRNTLTQQLNTDELKIDIIIFSKLFGNSLVSSFSFHFLVLRFGHSCLFSQKSFFFRAFSWPFAQKMLHTYTTECNAINFNVGNAPASATESARIGNFWCFQSNMSWICASISMIQIVWTEIFRGRIENERSWAFDFCYNCVFKLFRMQRLYG